MTQACAVGAEPLLIYASDKAMNAEPIPLNDALKAFIRFDNKFFSQELAQTEQEQHEDSRKRGPISLSSPDSKRRNRSNSLDSLATNHASAGDVDMEDEMRAEFLKSSDGTGFENGTESVNTGFDHNMADAIPLAVPHSNDLVDLLPPTYEDKVESKETGSAKTGPSMDGASERMGRVSLDEDKMDVDPSQTVSSQVSGSSPHTEDSDITVKPTNPADDGTTMTKSPEMQERSNNPFLAKAVNTAAATTASDSSQQQYSRAVMDF